MAKYKTAFQIAAVIALLIHYEYAFGDFVVDFHRIGMGLLYIALFTTLWSGADYFYKFFRKVLSP